MYQVQRTISASNFSGLSIVKWNLEKSGSQDIIIIGVPSPTIVHRKAHIFFVIRYFVFVVGGPFTWTLLFNRPGKSNVFNGWLALWGRYCMLIPQKLLVNFALVFDPVAQLFVSPAFHVCSSSMSMLEINEILELLLPNFVMMVSFLWRFLSLYIFWSLWFFNIASVFFQIYHRLPFLVYFCIVIIWVFPFSTM